jgi:hypothetical protein
VSELRLGVGSTVKKISPSAYQALRDAIPAVVWNKRPFETFLRTALRDYGELLAGLNFADAKRMVADELVDRLIVNEHTYHDVTLVLMRELSSMKRFPNLERIKDPEDRKLRVAEAEAAVGLLSYVIKDYQEDLAAAERQTADIQARAAQASALRRFQGDLELLKTRFIELQGEADVHRPDIFAAKVRRKGKNAVGLFISVNGFTEPFKAAYRESTPFITMDGADIYSVFENRVRLDDLIRAKKRHANETGSCFLPASQVVS